MNASGKKFLFILYFTPPAPGTAPRRNFKIAKFLTEKSGRSIVFTAAYPSKPVVAHEDMDVRPIQAWDYRTLLRRRKKDGYLPEQQKSAVWKQWSIKLINTFPFNILIGEGGLIYFFSILRRGNRVIQNENITHLYSSFRPFADHYAAYWLKKKHPELFWIADFRDLIVDPHYHHLFFPRPHQRFFKKLFSRANLLTTVSAGLASHLKEYNSNVAVVRNGIEGEIIPVAPRPSTHFTLTYTGSMFLNTRNPKPVFEAVRALSDGGKIDINDILWVYAGKDSYTWHTLARVYHMEANVKDYGVLSGQEALSLQRDACINLLLTISSPQLQGVLTGKMIEYFESGSPVLAIVSGQNDPELERILHEVEIGQSFSDRALDAAGIEDFIYREYSYWKQTGMNRKPVKADILRNKYSMEVTMESLLHQL